MASTVRALWSLIFLSSFLILKSGGTSLAIGKVGILVMAHGGEAEWNAAVEKSVDPLRSFCPVTVAFGMADRASLESAIDRLETEGVSRIAVVRLFVSSESFAHQTEYLLGIRPDPPKEFIEHPMVHRNENHKNSARSAVQKHALVVLNQEGLLDSPLISQIIAERIKKLSAAPAQESVLILAHGAEDDKENERWLLKLSESIKKISELDRFRTVKIQTLREDWGKERKISERRIRKFVEAGARDSGRVIVIPFRVFGFGPYREILKGLSYVADELGMLPHPNVTEWIKTEAVHCCLRAGWENPFLHFQ